MSTTMEKLNRMRGQLAKVREETKEISGRAVCATASIGGAVGTAWAIKRFGKNGRLLIPGTEIDAPYVAGGLLALVGIAGLADKHSEVVMNLGCSIVGTQAALDIVASK